jgi:hypothetical protein
MQLRMSLVLFFMLVVTSNVAAQDVTRAVEPGAKLRQQLFEVQGKEAELRIQLAQIVEALKPENIERSFAGIGSTKPEELREHRRRLLTIEKDGVLAQLKILEQRRSDLETAIPVAEAAAYLESARPSPNAATQTLMAQNLQSSAGLRLVMVPAVIIVMLVVGAVTFLTVRKAS